MTQSAEPSAQDLIDEARKIGHRRDRSTVVVGIVFIVATFGLVITLAILAASVRNSGVSATEARDAARARLAADARADCRAAVSGEFQKQRDIRDDFSGDLQSQLNAVLLGSSLGQRPGPAAIQQYFNTQTVFEWQRTLVRNLPTAGDAVDDGYTLDGVHHDACPKVPVVVPGG